MPTGPQHRAPLLRLIYYRQSAFRECCSGRSQPQLQSRLYVQVIAQTPKEKWDDLVFLQDGQMEPFRQSKALYETTQVDC